MPKTTIIATNISTSGQSESVQCELLMKHPRPVYIIGHRCNDLSDINVAVSSGANAIECDLVYDEDDKIIYVSHGRKSGVTLTEWLSHANKVAKDYRHFTLIIFDIKFEFSNTFETVKTEVSNALDSIDIKTIFSTADNSEHDIFSEVSQSDLSNNEVLAIDQIKNAGTIETYFRNENITNCWYGYGVFRFGVRKVMPTIKAAVRLRDTNQVFKKAYVWTLVKKSSIQEYLEDIQVDGVMVNVRGASPGGRLNDGLQDALEVVENSPKLRLAKRGDSIVVVHDEIYGEKRLANRA